MSGRYLEDFAVGQTFGSGRLRVDKEQIKAFAAEFDPQPFHLDEDPARDTIFRGLAASGWHRAALTMRLLVESEIEPAGASLARDSMSSVGRGPCDLGMSSTSKVKCSRCDRRGHVQIKD
jgi:acyl dehydratase